jgi:hypothetical protein
MKLFNCFSVPGYHTSIISTFGVDFDAYEAIALPRLRDAGCNNNILVADARMLVQSMSDDARRPKFAGWRYSVVAAQSTGVFHPKLILQLGKTSGRLLVASANTTAAGLAGNLEVVGEVATDDTDAQAAPLLRAALDYLAQFVAPSSVPRKQLEWATTRARWLPRSKAATDATVELPNGARLGFRARRGEKGLGERFAEFVGERVVKRLIVASPYWDHDLRALRALAERMRAKDIAVLVQKQAALFPVHALGRSGRVRLFDVNRVPVTNASRFAHAKLLVAESDEGDCVFFGSANCTTAALGTPYAPGDNEEACLCRDLPPGEAVKVLDLEAALSAGAEVEPADMPGFVPADDIPLAEFEARIPGWFELSGDLLLWWPARNFHVVGAEVELLDRDGKPADGTLTRIGGESSPVSYRVDGRIQPHFARVRTGVFESSLAVVIVEEAIREAQRRTKSRGAEKALDLLGDDEAFEGLWVLEVIQKLTAAEDEVRAPKGAGDTPRRSSAGDEEEGASKVLPYEEFIAGRRTEGDQVPVALSHLTSTHHESVRGFLNALLGKRAVSEIAGGGDEGPAPDFGMGDETPDGALAVEADERFNTRSEGTVPARQDEDGVNKLRRRQEYVKDTQKSLVEAVERFLSGFHAAEARTQPLGVVDLLRLRALLVVVLGAGSSKSDRLPRDLNSPVRRRQVLPSRGDASWRRLVGRLLYDFFRNHDGARRPLVQRLVLAQDDGQGLPEDVIETWATCFWAACACRAAVDEKGFGCNPSPQENLTALDLYGVTRLPEAQAMGKAVLEIFDGMNRRYGARLGVVPELVAREHRMLIGAARAKARMSG